VLLDKLQIFQDHAARDIADKSGGAMYQKSEAFSFAKNAEHNKLRGARAAHGDKDLDRKKRANQRWRLCKIGNWSFSFRHNVAFTKKSLPCHLTDMESYLLT
jgi:hypothetical protein